MDAAHLPERSTQSGKDTPVWMYLQRLPEKYRLPLALRYGDNLFSLRIVSSSAWSSILCASFPIYTPSIAYDAAEYHREAASHSEFSVLYCF